MDTLIEFEGHKVRMVGTPERPEWVASDLEGPLGIQNIRQVVSKFNERDKGVCSVYTLGGNQAVTTVNEFGLYRLIFKSRTPAAERFQNFVFYEVLPSLRQYNCYPPPTFERGSRAIVERRGTLSVKRALADFMVATGQNLDDHEFRLENLEQAKAAEEEAKKKRLPPYEFSLHEKYSLLFDAERHIKTTLGVIDLYSEGKYIIEIKDENKWSDALGQLNGKYRNYDTRAIRLAILFTPPGKKPHPKPRRLKIAKQLNEYGIRVLFDDDSDTEYNFQSPTQQRLF